MSLHTETMGKTGPLMAFIHPIPMDNSCWLYQMAHFSTWFRTMAIDLPGWGRSDPAPGITMSQGARACWETIDAVSSEPVVLCGISVGCHLAIHMAALRPERIAAVILSGCGWPEGEALSALNNRYRARVVSYRQQGAPFRVVHSFHGFSPDFRDGPLAHYFADMLGERNGWADLETMIDWFRALEEPDPVEGVRAPTLIIIGTEDGSYPHAPALQQKIVGSELAIIQGAGHVCNMEQPWAWDRHALSFLQRLGLVKLDS